MASRSLLACLLAAVALGAAEDENPLRLAVREAPPFASLDETGVWRGISVDLWREVAGIVGRKGSFVPVEEMDALLDGVAAGEYDVGVGAITATPNRERRMDFSHAIFSTGLGAAVRVEEQGWLGSLGEFFSLKFLQVVAALTGVLLLAGLLVWVFERRHNPQFPQRTVRGLGSGFWWSAVTMTTVGYGDKAPVTVGGRMVALVWMFTSIVIISGFTAAIASSLTVGSIRGGVTTLADLDRVAVGVVDGTTGAVEAERRRYQRRVYPDLDAAFAALADGRVDAVIHDQPLLRYRIVGDGRYAVLQGTLGRQDYAFALPPRSPLREPVNRALLELIDRGRIGDLVSRYLEVGE